jgi:hypothetical protein
VNGVSIAGDGAGIAGAIAAVDQGRIAAIAAARDLGKITPEAAPGMQEASRRKLRGIDRFRGAMDETYSPGPGLFELATPETLVCRCEEVTMGRLDAEIAAGMHEIESLKLETRITMGPCQGRMCLPAICQRLAASTQRSPAEVPLPRPRSPTKPLPLAWLEVAEPGAVTSNDAEEPKAPTAGERA